IDAYFESMSGFTTTGATILDPSIGDYMDIYPHSILMWRAVTTWLGGMGIIVFSVVILARFLEGGLHLFKAEVAGASVTRLRPRLHQTARILWGVYGFFTLLSIILMMGAGMGPFDSIATSFSTLSTGGFSVHSNNIGFYDSPGVELVMMFFMIVGATNFVLHYRIMTGKYLDAFKDRELQTFLTWLALVCIVVVSALAISGYYGFGESLRKGIFQCVSAGTTSGFSTAGDIAMWPPLAHILLVFLMLVGATLGSTSGGLKVSRIYILVKNVKNGILKAIHPRVVQQVKVRGRIIPDKVVARVQILLFSYIMILFLSMIALCASGVSVQDSLSAVASCLANSGLGIFGPGEGFHTLPSFAKVVLTFDMWIGRLEIITGLIILSPSTYRT
ncbi:MAG: TrkH family potassium uptake protein, partial [Thermoplasmata archaeon]|nr:TrkH family potassium uptake protein [Thermoplasmata archaeon]